MTTPDRTDRLRRKRTFRPRVGGHVKAAPAVTDTSGDRVDGEGAAPRHRAGPDGEDTVHEEPEAAAGTTVLRRAAPRRSVAAHREVVVRRLLGRGLSSRLLRRLLPEWGPLIDRAAAEAEVTA